MQAKRDDWIRNQAAIAPPYLKKGDLIGVTCPASKIEAEAAAYSCDVLRAWGYKVKTGKTLEGHYHNFSAPDNVRRDELQEMLDDGKMQAIVFGRGGYGVLRILDEVDFSEFVKCPKWLCGYSDITALHIHILKNFQIQTIHSLMCSGITPESHQDIYVRSLRNALAGKPLAYTFEGREQNRQGNARGLLVGGNLCLLAAICGSNSQPSMDGKILFIEDTGEYRYNIDRMMLTLKRAGWLDGLAGLIVGSFTAVKDTDEPFGQREWELIYDKVKTYDYPVAFDFPVGHQKENYALKEGAAYALHVGSECSLKEITF